MPYLGIFGIEFEKTIVISEISNLEFLKYESLAHTVNFGISPLFLTVRGPVFLKVRVPVCLKV